MATSQPILSVAQAFRESKLFSGLTKTCAAFAAILLLFSATASGQGEVPLITVATDQSALSLSNQFGVPANSAINQSGDFAFVGNGDTALFLRLAGTSAATRLLQIDDELPNFPGSHIQSILPELGINSSRTLFFGAWFTGADGASHSTLMTYAGTTYRTVVTSDNFIPNSTTSTYGINLVPGSIDDSGDVNFGAVPTGTNSFAYFIAPAGFTTVFRIAGTTDTPPLSCTWCTALGISPVSFLNGAPAGGGVITEFPLTSSIPKLNAQGQMLLGLWGGLFIGGKDGSFTLVPMAASGPCSPNPPANATSYIPLPGPPAFLNNSGAVAFTNPPNSASGAICVAMPASQGVAPPFPTAIISAGDAAPASVGGGTMISPVALGFDDSGDIVFQSPISGSNVTTSALLRYQASSGQSNLVAYVCEQAPGTSGGFFSLIPCDSSWGSGSIISVSSLTPFSGVSIAKDGTVSFYSVLTTGGSAIYRQKPAASTPEFISLANNGTAPIVEISGNVLLAASGPFLINSQSQILNNDSVFFVSYLASGTADFAEYLGSPGNVQTLMSTADTLPSGARTLLGNFPPQAAGHFVAFTAQPAAGRRNLLESDLTTGEIKRVTSDNDPAFAAAEAPYGNPLLSSNFFLNDTGMVAFEAASTFSAGGFGSISFTSLTNSTWVNSAPVCGTIFVWSPSGVLTKVAAAGDSVPNSSSKFSCVALNSQPPSPLNHSGELTFLSSAPLLSGSGCAFCGVPPVSANLGVDGAYLYHPGGAITEIAAANDTLPGQTQATTFVPYLATPLNSAGQVGFGAQLGATTQAFYLENGSSVQSVMALGDSVPGGSDTFGFPHFISGLSDSGNLAFTAATGSAIDGLFLAPAGGAIQTLALQGGAAPVPGGGVYSLSDAIAGFTSFPGSTPVTTYSFKNFAEMNSESDVAFGSDITGGSADSGYFRMLQGGSAPGTVLPAAVQGEALPGGGTLNTILAVSSVGGTFALGPDGSLAFVNPFTTSSGLNQGMFVARPDGTLLKVAATGDVLPGGGILSGISISPKLAAGNAGTFAFLGGIFEGSARSGIFATAIPPGTAATTITLSPLSATAVAQQPAALSAAVVSSVPGSPSGTVTFFANGISIGTGTLNSSGQASMNTSTLSAGQDTIVAQYSGDANFAAGNSSQLAIVVTGFAPLPTSLAVTRGQNLVIPLTLYGPATPAMSFTLSCSGLPANATCSFDNNPVTPDPSGTTVHLTLTTTMASAKLPLGLPLNGIPPIPGYQLATLLAALLAAATLFWRRAHQWRLAACACVAAFALALAMGGCGAVGTGSNQPVVPGTPAGAATFTVTGTSGGTTISTVVNVTVQ
ncbi:MAG TPA: Ig-like domain-containing protein [Candidatus Saccharimonadales bacterium]|jgi:hypothetical protein|nr:Ig-like domain-containing protein [Candidatus Saccharimonadales bacterium]